MHDRSDSAALETAIAPVFHALVADDERIVRNIVIRALKREGFACVGAQDGHEAFQRARERRFDVIVVDLVMPRLHGPALIGKLLELPYRPAIVVLTALQSPELAKELIGQGVDYFEGKPASMELFAAKVRALVEKRAASEPAAARALR